MTASDKNGLALVRGDSVTVTCTIREIYPNGMLALESSDNSTSMDSKTTIYPIPSVRVEKVE